MARVSAVVLISLLVRDTFNQQIFHIPRAQLPYLVYLFILSFPYNQIVRNELY